MKNIVTLIIMSSFLLVGCTVPKWIEMFEKVTYDDLEMRPVSLYLDGEKFMSEKDKREIREYKWLMPKSVFATLTKTEDGLNFYYNRDIPADCDFADSLHLSLIFNGLPCFPETDVKYVRKDPEFDNWPSMPRINFWVNGGAMRENIATEQWIQFTVIDTLNKVVSGCFEFNARHIVDESLTYTVKEGVFENIPLIYK